MVTRALAALLLLALAASARAAGPGSDVFEFFREESQATTALRHLAPTDKTPLAVDVITSEEIKASGAVDLWDLLRFRVGMDVIEGRSEAGFDRAVVSVRGIPRDAVTELRVLVDGRAVNSPIDNGAMWDHIPVQVQDVERIEIVRGPNAALYGANAGTGVVNIITRRPEKDFSATASAWGGSLGAREGYASVEAARRGWGARFSASDRAQGGFPKADGSGEADDWLRRQVANVRAWCSPASGTTFELLAGLLRDGHGIEMSGHPQVHAVNHFQTVRLTREFDGGSTLEARASRTDDQNGESPDVNGQDSQTRYWKYDSEAFHSIPWGEGRLRSTYGIGWRYEASTADELYGPGAGVVTNRVVRGFFHQEIQVLDSLSVLGGLSNETATAGGYHKDFQVAAVWSPVAEQSLRASYSRANNMPGLENRYASQPFPVAANPFPPPAFFSGVLIGSTGLKPSPLTDYEAGWTGRFLDRTLTAELTGFYMYIQDHVNLDVTTTVPPYVFTEQFDNTNTVQLRGVEASLKWRFAPGRSVYANFTRETVTDQDHHDLYVKTTPNEKANLGFDVALPAGLRASMNAGYKDNYLADSNLGTAQDFIRAFWRLDARLGWTVRPGLELFVGGRNLAAPDRREYIDGLVVPRVFYGGATIRY